MKYGIKIFILFLMISFIFSSYVFAKGKKDSTLDYPTKMIEFVCPFGVGGSTDLAARSLAATMPKYLKQSIMVVNKPGGGGQIGMDYLLKKPADGYSIILAVIGPWTIYPAMHPDAIFNYTNFKYIGRAEITPCVLVARPSDKYKDLKGLTEVIKNNPKALKYGIAGNGTISELGIKAYMMLAGIPMENAIGVPYEGTGEATLAILGNHVDFMYVNLSPVLDHIKNGTLIPLALSVKEKDLPNVPTLKELGYEGAGISSWKGLAAHKDTPDAIIKILEETLLLCTKDPEWIKTQEGLGVVPAYMNGKDFEAYIKSEFETFKKLAASMKK